MSIIDELLKEVESDDIDHQVKELCNHISAEEIGGFKNLTLMPQGPNIFLAIETPGKAKKEIAFLCLERELSHSYIITYWTTSTSSSGELKRTKVWEVSEDEPTRILREFAKKIKFMKGE